MKILAALVSLAGFLACLAIWLSLPALTWRVGFAWMGAGVFYQLIRTRGFRSPLGFSADRFPF